MRGVFKVLGLGLLCMVLFVFVAGRGWLGGAVTAGVPSDHARSAGLPASRDAEQGEVAAGLGVEDRKQILFGDFHVHTSFSQDAYTMSLPLAGGTGRHTVSDACDFARFCSSLDFWSINDHAESSTPRRWRETIEAIRQCDGVGGNDDGSTDLVSFLGWEWSHMGTTPENHYGHRNVIFRDLESAKVPTRPIAADMPADYFRASSTLTLGILPIVARDTAYFRYANYSQETVSPERCAKGIPVRDLPEDCREYAATPGELFAKLDDWGFESLVIPHGSAWGMYTPKGSDWKKQLTSSDHDPVLQRLVEVYSGHGNIEEYRPWRAVTIAADGTRTCPTPTEGYVPGCWRAGEIIRARCLAEEGAPDSQCEMRAAQARQYFSDAPSGLGHLSVPAGDFNEWREAGQCPDCFLPAFNYRPASSVQSMLARSAMGEDGEPMRFRFGFIGSSDIHTARPGTGYKDQQRTKMSDSRMARVDLPVPTPKDDPVATAREADPLSVAPNDWIERDRAGSYYYTGGLVAVHAPSRSREGVWEALESRETYATSGPRILLWFDLLNAPAAGDASRVVDGRAPMGSVVEMADAPLFEVRAAGSREQLPGCDAEIIDNVGAQRLERLCGGECFRPADRRRRISRIEVVRIRPQRSDGEELATLIEDPWRSFDCEPDPTGCSIQFRDEEFAPGARNAVYYVRAIEEPSLAVNGGNMRCEGESCSQPLPCDPWAPDSEDCLEGIEERAWSSPVFVDWSG